MSRSRRTVYLDSDDDADDIRIVSASSGGHSMPPLPSNPHSVSHMRPNPTPPTVARSSRRSAPAASCGAVTPTTVRSSRSRPGTPATAHVDSSTRPIVTLDDDDDEPPPVEKPSLAQRERERQMLQHQQPVPTPAAVSGPIVLDDSQPLEEPPRKQPSKQHARRRSARKQSGTPHALGPIVSGPIVLEDSQPLVVNQQKLPQAHVGRRSRRRATEPAASICGGDQTSPNTSPTPDQPPEARRQRRQTPPVTPAPTRGLPVSAPAPVAAVTIHSSPVHIPSSDIVESVAAKPPQQVTEPTIVVDPLFSQDINTRNETQHWQIFPSSSPNVKTKTRQTQLLLTDQDEKQQTKHQIPSEISSPLFARQPSSPIRSSDQTTSKPEKIWSQCTQQDLFPELPIIPPNLRLAVPSDEDWEFPADSQSQSQRTISRVLHKQSFLPQHPSSPEQPPQPQPPALQQQPITPSRRLSTVIPPSSPTPKPASTSIQAPPPTNSFASTNKGAGSNIVRLNRPSPFTLLPASAYAPCAYCKQRVTAAAHVQHQATCEKCPQPKLKKAPSLPKGQRTLFDMVPGASPKGQDAASEAMEVVTPGSAGQARARGTPGSTGDGKAVLRCRPKVATVTPSERPSPASVSSSLASPRNESHRHTLMQSPPMSPLRPTHPSSHAMLVPAPGPLPTPALSGTSNTTAQESVSARWVSGTQWMDDTDDTWLAEFGNGFTQPALANKSPQRAPPTPVPIPVPAPAIKVSARAPLPSPPVPSKPMVSSTGDDSQGFAFDDEDPAVAAKASVLNALGIQDQQVSQPLPPLSGSAGSPVVLDQSPSQPLVPPPPTQPDPLPQRKPSSSRRPVIASSDSSSDADENLAPMPVGRLRGKKRRRELQGGRLTPPKQPQVPPSVAGVHLNGDAGVDARPFPPPVLPQHQQHQPHLDPQQGQVSLAGPWNPPRLPKHDHVQAPHTCTHVLQPPHHQASLPPLPSAPSHFPHDQSLYQARPRGTPDDPLMQCLRSQFGGGYGQVLTSGSATGAKTQQYQQPQPMAGEGLQTGGSRSQPALGSGSRGRGRGRGRRASGGVAGTRLGAT